MWCLRSCLYVHNCFNGVSFNEIGFSTRASQKERSAEGVLYRGLFAPAGVPPAFFLIPAKPGAPRPGHCVSPAIPERPDPPFPERWLHMAVCPYGSPRPDF